MPYEVTAEQIQQWRDEDFCNPPRPLDSEEFEAFADAYIWAAVEEDPWAGELCIGDVRGLFTPDPPPVKEDVT